jgi:hypothetical protein
MNRLHHLQQTILKNIYDNKLSNEKYTIEFIILDYNSSDGLEYWFQNNMTSFIEAGLVKFYRTTEPLYFNRSHSRNLAFKLASGDIICNIDADNYLGVGFSNYIYNCFIKGNNEFLTPDFRQRDVIGRLCLKKTDFILQRGYNENMNGYGFEDLEFYARMAINGLQHEFIYNSDFLNVIHHSDKERYENEHLNNNFESMYIRHINPWTSKIFIIYKDRTCEIGILVNNQILRSKAGNEQSSIKVINEMDKFEIYSDNNSLITLDGEWVKGGWERFDDTIKISLVNLGESNYKFINNALIEQGSGCVFKKVVKNDIKDNFIFLKTQLTNRNILNKTRRSISANVNELGFGRGIVFKNFRNDIPIQII